MWGWLQPGLGLKRWIAVILAGLFVLSLGISGILDLFIPPLTGLGLRFYILTGLGILLITGGFVGLFYVFVTRLHTGKEPVIDKLTRASRVGWGPNIVALGGGTGLSTLLRGLKKITANITAVVAVTDDGGSSGRLRREFDVPAPGDLRSCLVALAPEERSLSELFSYRFKKGGELEGHSVGNILLTALTDLYGGFPEAVRASSEVLAIEGRVLPAMLGCPELKAEFKDDSTVRGESAIAAEGKKISRLEVVPRPLQTNPEAISAVANAELLVAGPGSLYTSIITNFMEPELCRAINSSPAPLVYICNLMTQAGETDNFSVSDHLKVFQQVPPEPVEFDHLLVNTRRPPKDLLEEYSREGAQPVNFDYSALKDMDVEIHADNFIESGQHLRHDLDKIIEHLQLILDDRWNSGWKKKS
ncbi:MAG: gluconeogenesis factor YvcK family protein [bacterium]